MEIRELDATLLPSYRALRLRALGEHPEAFGASAADEAALPDAAWQARLRQPGSDAFVLCGTVADTVIAMARFHRQSSPKERHRGHVTSVYVAPEHRGGAHARTLLRALIDRAFSLADLDVLFLGVGTHNAPARRTYAALGFVAYGEDPFALRVDGALIPELLMLLARPTR